MAAKPKTEKRAPARKKAAAKKKANSFWEKFKDLGKEPKKPSKLTNENAAKQLKKKAPKKKAAVKKKAPKKKKDKLYKKATW